VTTSTQLQNLILRFVVTPATNFTTSHDYIQLQVN